MPSDPSDHLQQRRDALTDWERGLRPKGDRHWVLWLALATVLVFLAWRGAEWLLTQQRAPRPASSLSTVRPSAVPSAAKTDGELPARGRPEPSPESYAVTKCISVSGRAEYSDGPCPDGSRATTVWIQPDVNLADGMSAAAREASMRNNSAVAAQVQQVEQQVAQKTRDAPSECAALDARIKWIDATARQPQGAPTQDGLASEKRSARERQSRLRCQ